MYNICDALLCLYQPNDFNVTKSEPKLIITAAEILHNSLHSIKGCIANILLAFMTYHLNLCSNRLPQYQNTTNVLKSIEGIRRSYRKAPVLLINTQNSYSARLINFLANIYSFADEICLSFFYQTNFWPLNSYVAEGIGDWRSK